MLDVILREQENCCLYCGLEFGTTNILKNDEILLELKWDHILPWSYAHNATADNIAASCQVCNAIKWNHIYPSIEAAQADIAVRRKAKGYRF